MKNLLMLEAPDELAGGTAVETPPSPAQTSAPAADSSSPPSGAAVSSQGTSSTAPSSSAPAADGAAAATSPAAAAQVQASWRDQLREHGVDLTSVADEKQALAALAQAYRDAQQLRPIAPYASAYQQHATQSAEYMKSQQARQAPQQAQQQGPWYEQFGWKPPEWNPAWGSLLTTDAEGRVVAKPGAPPDLVPKYYAHEQWRREQLEKFASNPYEFFQQPIEHLATQIAQREVQRHLSSFQDQSGAREFVAQNSPWLYEKDTAGQIKMEQAFNPATGRYTQQPMLSPWGARFKECVQGEAERQARHNYSDIEEQKARALQQVQLEYALYQLGQNQQAGAATPGAPAGNGAAPRTPRQQANEQFLQGNNAPGKRPGGNAANAQTPINGMNLEQILQQRFKAAGIEQI